MIYQSALSLRVVESRPFLFQALKLPFPGTLKNDIYIRAAGKLSTSELGNVVRNG